MKNRTILDNKKAKLIKFLWVSTRSLYCLQQDRISTKQIPIVAKELKLKKMRRKMATCRSIILWPFILTTATHSLSNLCSRVDHKRTKEERNLHLGLIYVIVVQGKKSILCKTATYFPSMAFLDFFFANFAFCLSSIFSFDLFLPFLTFLSHFDHHSLSFDHLHFVLFGL